MYTNIDNKQQTIKLPIDNFIYHIIVYNAIGFIKKY